jgi:hypothetical protein
MRKPEAVSESAHVVQDANVGMIQRRYRMHLAREAIAEAFAGDFDGHGAPHPGIGGAIHFAHTAGADAFGDLIRADPIAW